MCSEIDLNIQTDNYTEIKNEFEEAGADYSINIILKFDNNAFDKITRQIIESPYFNIPTLNDPIVNILNF